MELEFSDLKNLESFRNGLLETWESDSDSFSSLYSDYKCYAKNAFKYEQYGRPVTCLVVSCTLNYYMYYVC